MEPVVKQEIFEPREFPEKNRSVDVCKEAPLIELSSSDTDSDSDDYSDSDGDSSLVALGKRSSNGLNGGSSKKRRLDELGVVLPVGFLDPLPPEEPLPIQRSQTVAVVQSCKQFWKAGDYEGSAGVDSPSFTGGMDHVRVHPKFLHSNATSHKWALGAFAELLDNSLDEICHGATYVNVDVLENKKDGTKMLLVEDDGGGMDPDKMRHCMSLGYSVKSKLANTIGQYGNGFKTSTMRLGADVIVFSRCCGKDGKSPTQSIGMLSYTFLRSTGKEDIVVPMLDYEKGERDWNTILRSTRDDWNRNLETIVQWSPYSSEADLLQQFNVFKDQGTRIIIYNLWEDDEGELELDFETDKHDIQIRGVNRDERKIQMAKQFPNSRHFLTYRHSLRSYASILYLQLPPGFQITLRGEEVEHHNIVNDMMLEDTTTYRPQQFMDRVPKEQNVVAVVTIGFVKDARDHIDVQGFNVYHKNRLIKPFWRVWNAAGSDGRGVIGVLEANFVEPAHDKQGFERTIILSRLEARLLHIQKNYWSTKCHLIGYAPRRHKKLIRESAEKGNSPDLLPQSSRHSMKSISPRDRTPVPNTDKYHSPSKPSVSVAQKHGNGNVYGKDEKMGTKYVRKTSSSSEPMSSSAEDVSDDTIPTAPPERVTKGSNQIASPAKKAVQKNGSHKIQSSPYAGKGEILKGHASDRRTDRVTTHLQSKEADIDGNAHSPLNSGRQRLEQLKEDNRELRERIQEKDDLNLCDLLHDIQLERERTKFLKTKLQEAERKIEEMNKEQDALIDIFSEERIRRDNEEENLRNKLKDASGTIQELLNKVRLLERMKAPICKPER